MEPWINYPFLDSDFCSCGHRFDFHVGGKCEQCQCAAYERIPPRDWIVTRVDLAPTHMGRGYVIEGINMNAPAWGYQRKFTWYFTGAIHCHAFDRRYDCSTAAITPDALALMCNGNARTEIHY